MINRAMRWSLCLSVGLTFIFASIALVTPFWISVDLSKLSPTDPLTSEGHLITCLDPYNTLDRRQCSWIESEDEELIHARNLSIIGTVFIFLATVLTPLLFLKPRIAKFSAGFIMVALLSGGKHLEKPKFH